MSQKTVLKAHGIALRGEILGLIFELPDKQRKEFYALAEVGAILERLGVKFKERVPKEIPLTERAKERVEQLDRFLKVPERTLYFSEGDFEIRGSSLSGDLREVWNLLRKHGLIADAAKGVRGTRRLYRLTDSPEAIRRGQAGVFSSKGSQSFWQEMLAA